MDARLVGARMGLIVLFHARNLVVPMSVFGWLVVAFSDAPGGGLGWRDGWEHVVVEVVSGL